MPGAYGGSDDPSRPTTGTYWRENIDGNLPHDQPAEVIRRACLLTLSEFQDFVDEMTATPWPGTRVPPNAQALSNEDASVELFYGETLDDPVLVVGRLTLL
jgi:hypothetical protein